MPNRRGISLLELLLTMSACTVILTTSAALIHRAMHTQSRARAFCDGERSALRLGESLRRDVHAAREATIGDAAGDNGPLVSLKLAEGRTVEYRQAAGRVERILLIGERPQAREAFVFPADTKLAAQQPSPRLVVLSITPPPAEGESSDKPLTPFSQPVSLQVEAVLGRNASLVEVEPATERQEAAP